MRLYYVITLLLSLIVMACQTTPAMKLSGNTVVWQGITLKSGKAETGVGLMTEDGDVLLEPIHESMGIAGNSAYARVKGERTVRQYRLSRKGVRVSVSRVDTTPYSMVTNIESNGKLSGAAFFALPKDTGGHMLPRDVALLDVDGNVISVYAEGDSLPRRYGKVWIQYLGGKGKYIFVDDDGQPVSPPLANVVSINKKIYAVDLGDDFYLPITSSGSLPMEGEGFIGFKLIGFKSLPKYWVSHYEIAGKKQYGYASSDLSFSSGPVWSEHVFWRLSSPPFPESQLVPEYPQDEYILARSVEDGLWRLYLARSRHERDFPKSMPKLIGGPAITREEAIASEVASINHEYQNLLMAERERRIKSHQKKLADEMARQREAKEKARIAAEQKKLQEAKAKREAAQLAEYEKQFQAALQAGDRKTAYRLSQQVKGNAYALFLIHFDIQTSAASWWRAYSWASDIELSKKCYANFERLNKRDIAAAEAQARAEANATPRFDWGSFWSGVNAAQSRQIKNDAFGNKNTSDKTRQYTESLRRWTYGEQNWKPLPP